MGRRYSVIGDQNASTTGATDTMLVLASATTVQPKIYGLVIGSAATPADQAVRIDLQRVTAIGADTAVTPAKHDLADPVSLTTCGSNNTGAHTYTADTVLMQISLNQQATFAWGTVPEEGFVMPATANAGAGTHFIVVSGGTALFECTFLFEE